MDAPEARRYGRFVAGGGAAYPETPSLVSPHATLFSAVRRGGAAPLRTGAPVSAAATAAAATAASGVPLHSVTGANSNSAIPSANPLAPLASGGGAYQKTVAASRPAWGDYLRLLSAVRVDAEVTAVYVPVHVEPFTNNARCAVA